MSAASTRVDDLAGFVGPAERPRAPLILLLFAALIFAASGLADAGGALRVALTGERAHARILVGVDQISVRYRDVDGVLRQARLAHGAAGLAAGPTLIAYDAAIPDEAYVIEGAAAWRGPGLRLGLALGLITLAGWLWPRGAF